MKKTIKILIVSLLTLALTFVAVACGSSNDETKVGMQYKKVNANSNYTLTKYIEEENVTTLDIGAVATAKGIVIEKIKANAFSGNSTLTKIIVPSTVKVIEKGAFSGMEKLVEIELPFVGSTAVADSYLYETADAENKSVDAMRSFGYIFGTTSYDYGKAETMYYNETSSTTFYIPETLQKITINAVENYKIPMYAFNDLIDVAEIELKGNITAIGAYAFAGCAVSKVNIPATVTAILEGAFSQCPSLKDGGLTFDGTPVVESFGDYAFYATQIKNFTVPASVKTIGDYCFASKVTETSIEIESALETIVLSSLTDVGDYAFAYCSNLSSINKALVNGTSTTYYKCTGLID